MIHSSPVKSPNTGFGPATKEERRANTAFPFSGAGLARGWLAFLAAWSPAIATMLYLKHVLLAEGGYWSTIVGLGLASDSHAPAAAFTRLQKLTFYRWDVALWVVLVPLAFAAASRFLPRKPLLASVAVLNVLLIAWLWIQRVAWLLTGRFLTASLIQDAAVWGARHPHDFGLYAPLSVTAKLAASIAVAMAAPLAVAKIAPERRAGGAWNILFRGAPAFAAALLVLSFGPWLPKTVYQNSTTGLIWQSTSSTADRTSKRLAGLPDAEVQAEYRRLTDTPPLQRYASAFHGKARDYDVIVWVCETLPMKAVEATGGLTGLPGFARLANSSLILKQHYTPSPYSSGAGFSLLTSMYPPNSLQWVFRATSSGRAPRIDGLLSELQRMKYETEAFLPGDASFDSDLQLDRVAGAKKIFVSDVHQQAYAKTPWERRLQLDETAFAELKRSVAAWTRNGNRYAAVFFPEIGHAPWDNVTGLPGSPTRLQLGEALAGLQGQWLAQLLDVLAQNHRLDKTVILVTGDHGIRTLNEDPALPRAMLDDYTFHVPLLLSAPGVLGPQTAVEGVTSHIDIAPSLLD
ncbi:MAG: sulfatase-like hydrolase/transferase, partial [Acidobacteriia bacterium]|nr:sulfatase-like hydrolase/transferase [Terriglobia bacterium]